MNNLESQMKLILKEIPVHIARLEVHPYEYYMGKICQLFPKTEENPNGYEPRGYTLSCDNCGGAFYSPEAFPYTELCPQCSEPDYPPELDYLPDGSGKELKPDRLLTDEGNIYDAGCGQEICCDILPKHLSGQNLEDCYLGISKVIQTFLDKRLKAQDAKTASILKAKYAADMEHLSHLVDDVISLEEQVKSKDAECQARVERIKREIETIGMNDLGFVHLIPEEWQSLWEGV